MNRKNIKSILLTTSITLGISLFVTGDVYAATYTTVSGDSLYKISRLLNTSVGNLMDDNKLTTYNLNIGQELNVSCETYSVKKGDTLYLISQKFNISLADLRKANNIYTNYIDVGQELNIPKTIVTTSAVKAAPVVAETAVQETSAPVVSPVENESYSAADLDLLSRLIMAEAQGQPYDAKVAVGSVVMNRVKSNLFPNSINEVIYQNISGYFQFTPVVTGWIDNPADAESINAAKEAFNGVDLTNNSLFYYDDSTTNAWILAKPISLTVGNMIFAY